MSQIVKIIACTILLSSLAAASSLTITPTTTLTSETSNNTSASSSFQAQSNGNIAPANVSKVDTHTLLYSGAETRIYTNIMHWFGPSNHISVGYNSDDPQQVQKQVDDHVSRGIDGTIVDWYGSSHTVDDTATQIMMRYAETLPGLPFKFAIMEDKGALLACSRTAGCDLNAKLISDLTYVYAMFEQSPAYMTDNGRPLVFFFGLEVYQINWDYVKANVPGNPLFIFQNQSGYTHAASDGAFSWVMINTSDPNDWKQSYLDSFYQTSLNNTAKRTFATTYKGFDDTLASWSLNRIMNQNCGQAWLKTWSEVGKYYNSSSPLENMQIVTWNDYEEGTEIETGIENCVAISASATANAVNWSVSGNEATVDHYTVFISQDGENLMPLASASVGIRSLGLSQFALAPGNYTIYVKAIGKPSMTNKMSGPVSYSVSGTGPIVELSVTPSNGSAPIAVTASTAGSSSSNGTITSARIDFGDGTVVNAATATHTYTAAGTYTIRATVYDTTNSSGTATTNVSVAANQPPRAYISVSPASGAAPLTVTASTSQSTDSDGFIASSSIDFGDGTIVAATTATHTYSTAGTYTVTGTVKDNGGATASAAATVNASTLATNKPPVVQLTVTPTATTIGTVVKASMAGTMDPDGSVATYSIDFGDGVVAYGSAASHRYVVPGTYVVTATAIDNAGASSSASQTVAIAALPFGVSCHTCRRAPVRQIRVLDGPLTSWSSKGRIAFQF